MCVQSSMCKLWQDLHRWNWKEVWSQIIGTYDWSGIQNTTYIHKKPSCIKFKEHNKSALTDHATQENHVINWSQAIRWSTESQSVLPDGSRRPYTCERKDNRPWTVMRAATNWATHKTAFLTRHLPSCQESEELSTSFFWRRPLLEVETSSFLGNYIGCVWWIN